MEQNKDHTRITCEIQFRSSFKLGTKSPAPHFINCVHTGRSQKMAAMIRGLSSGKIFRKVKQKVFKIFKLRTWKMIYRGVLKKQILKPICATIAYCPTV